MCQFGMGRWILLGVSVSWRLLHKPVVQQWASQDTWLNIPGAHLASQFSPPLRFLLLPSLSGSPTLFLPLGTVMHVCFLF